MNISYRWLRALAPTLEGTPQELSDRLGMLGAPVDEIVDLSEGLDDIVVARVEEVKPHPNADRLRLCMVNAGGAEMLQVVCGAPNVEAGYFYPFAPIGATMPDGMQIRKAKLRGETSNGMLCSARELGLGRDHSGLMTLAGDWNPGGGFVEQLQLDDTRLVLDITPNRPDLLSHVGVARELAPGGANDVQLPELGKTPELDFEHGESAAEAGGVSVTLEDAGDCPRYMAATIDDVTVAPSPEWLSSRLRAIGVRPINNVVDATNYVLHELGQPLHAFDRDLLGGTVRVRRAKEGETLRTLDGVDRRLDGDALLITDGERPVALAGIMGGEETEVSDGTTSLLIECALFDPLRVRKTAKALGLSTDASHRYERGVDPETQVLALRRVIELILATAGGKLSGPVVDAHPGDFARPVILVRESRVAQVLGIELTATEIAQLLNPIGFDAAPIGDSVEVKVPGYRPDVTREIDLIEEIARRRGYDSFEETLGAFRPGTVPTHPQVDLQKRVHERLVGAGFLQAITAAFAGEAEGRVPLLNPLSSEESHLRDTLIPGLLRRVEHNWAHGVRNIRLYEIGSAFAASSGALPREDLRVAAAFTGARRPPHWTAETEPFDVWDLKGLMADVADLVGASVEAGLGEEAPAGSLVSGVAFRIVDPEGVVIGRGGRVAEDAIDAPPWAEEVWALEMKLIPPDSAGTTAYRTLPAFPASERDLALIVPQGVHAEQIEAVIRGAGGEILKSVSPFDVYQGEGIPEGTRSIAWHLVFRHPERTLKDEEVDGAVAAIVRDLNSELDVRQR